MSSQEYLTLQGKASRRSQRRPQSLVPPVPPDSFASREAAALQESNGMHGPRIDAHMEAHDSTEHQQGPSKHKSASVSLSSEHDTIGRRTRSHRQEENAAAAPLQSPARDMGRRSARLQSRDEPLQEETPQVAAAPARDTAAERASRARARVVRQSADLHADPDANLPASDHQSSEEDGAAEYGQAVEPAEPAPTRRHTRAPHRASVPASSSRHSTPEPPERFSDVHNTGHALRRSTRHNARSPSVVGPAHAEAVPQIAPSGIRVTLRPSRHAQRQQQDDVTNMSPVPGRHSLRSGLRARH